MLENAHESRGSQGQSLEPIAPDWDGTIVGHQIGPYLVTEHGLAAVSYPTSFALPTLEDSTRQLAVKLISRKMNNDVILKPVSCRPFSSAALGKHPNIIAILDAGMTEDGYLYFVMEYVDGLPIDKYCDNQKLTVSARLKLFAQVIQAVQFAHQHVIIHGDLKPGNILVTAGPIPKLIDFRLLWPDRFRGQ